MSKLKSPQEKKRASLDHDRRNASGESPHGSRKSIPKSKAIQHQRERRVANQALSLVSSVVDAEVVESVEGVIKTKTRLKRVSGFKKYPDKPLGEVIKQKQERRAMRKKIRKYSQI